MDYSHLAHGRGSPDKGDENREIKYQPNKYGNKLLKYELAWSGQIKVDGKFYQYEKRVNTEDGDIRSRTEFTDDIYIRRKRMDGSWSKFNRSKPEMTEREFRLEFKNGGGN